MIPKGEVIIKEEPFVFVLKSALRNEKCEFCFSPAELKCSRCQYWRYCNKRCQKLAWAVHKLECNLLKKIVPKDVPGLAHMLIRILLKLKTADLEKYPDKTREKKRSFKDLMSHVAEIRNDAKRMEQFTSVAFVVQSVFGETETLNEEYLLELFGKVCINSFDILDIDMDSVGTGIYLNASILDHSCQPNSIAVFNGTTINIRSIKDIPDFEMNKVRISYTELLYLSSERRKVLQSMYYFICDCKRCVDETDDNLMQSMKCSRPSCSGFVSVMDSQKPKHTCSVCGMEVSEKKLKEYHDVIQLSDNCIQNMNSSDYAFIDVCETILTKQEKILNDLNIWRIKVLDLAFEACISFQRWDRAVELGFKLLPGFRKYYGFYHPLVGYLHMKLLKLVLLQNDKKRSVTLYEEATKILLVTHGNSHPLFEMLKEIMYC